VSALVSERRLVTRATLGLVGLGMEGEVYGRCVSCCGTSTGSSPPSAFCNLLNTGILPNELPTGSEEL